MAEFNFRLDQLDDPSEIARSIMGSTPGGLKTSASDRTKGDPRDVTLFSLSQILMGTPAIKDDKDVLSIIQSKVTGGIALIADHLADVPGLGNLVPDFIQDRVDDALADGTGARSFSIKTAEGEVPPYEGYAAASDPFIRQVVSLAKAEVGTHEDPPGSNKNKYALTMGTTQGLPWAHIFIAAMFKDADIPQASLTSTVSIQDAHDYAYAVNRVGQDPVVGSIAYFNYNGARNFSEKRLGVDHAGIVVEVNDSTIKTVEGDVAASGSGNQTDGIWVQEKKRRKEDVVEYAYPVYPDGEVIPFPVPEADKSGGPAGPGYQGDVEAVISGSVYTFPSNYEVATGDSGGDRPGAVALMNYINQRFPESGSYGICDYRHIGRDSSNDLSTHAEGRALDISVPDTPAGKRVGDQIFLLLAPNAVRLGIQAIAWYARWWSASSPDSKGHNDHRDHLHVELLRSAATNLTTADIEAALANRSYGGDQRTPGEAGPTVIISRSQWGAAEPDSTTPMTLPAPNVWLHHTAGSEPDGAAGVLQVQNFHMGPQRNMDDIAYSFIIDRQGRIYEGRGAGVVGGHTRTQNSTSHAICVLGNYQEESPSQATLDAIAKLLRYGKAMGWWPSAKLAGGHRDAPNAGTLCPGGNLYSRINDINTRAGG